jgi:nitrate/nitrite transporter NarK
MYLVLGFFSLLWAFFWIFTFFRKRNIHLRTMPPQSTISDASLLRIFLRSPTCLSLCALNLCFAYLLFFSLTWFPYYLEKTYRIFIGDAGFLTAIPWLVATLFLLAGGWMTDAIQKKTESLRAARSYQSILGFFLAAVCFFLMSYSADFVLNLSLFSLALGFIFLFQTPLFIVNVDLFPRHCSFSLGITIIFASVGIVFSPLVTSKALERTGDFHLALLIAAAVSLASALIAYFFLHPKKSLEHIRQ